MPKPSPRFSSKYDSFPEEIDEPALARFFSLSERDLKAARTHRGDHNRLGWALQLGCLRWLGWQPVTFAGLPTAAVTVVARQLNVASVALQDYTPSQRMWQYHAAEVVKHTSWRSFGAQERDDLLKLLRDRARQYTRLTALVDQAVQHLHSQQIVRPGLTVLEKVVARARAEATAALSKSIMARLTDKQRQSLDELITLVGPGEFSQLMQLQAPPGNPTVGTLLGLLKHIGSIRALGIEDLDLRDMIPNRLAELAQEAERQKLTELRRMPPTRRYTLLVALLNEQLYELNDNAVETHRRLIQEMGNRARGRRKQLMEERDKAVNDYMLLLKQIGEVLLNNDILPEVIRAVVFKDITTPDRLTQALREIEALAKPDGLNALVFLASSFSHLRQFSGRFLDGMRLRHTERAVNEWRAVEWMRRYEQGLESDFAQAPIDFIPYPLRKLVIGLEGMPDRRLWEITLHLELAKALAAGEIWVEHSREATPLSADLHVRPELRKAFLAEHPHLASFADFLRRLTAQYNETLQRVDKAWPDLEYVGFEDNELWVGRLPALPVPDEVNLARQRLYLLLPKKKLAQLLIETAHWVDYLAPLREAAGEDVRIKNMDERLFAVMMAEGCNIGIENMAECAGMSAEQLRLVAGRCLTPDALEKAIQLVIERYLQLPIAKVWGSGVWSSVDGQMVPLPVKSLTGVLHPKAGKGKRILTLHTTLGDQFVPLHGTVIGSPAHEAAYTLDGLFHHVLPIRPTHHTADTRGFTDLVFGVCALLGVYFAPRIKGLKDKRLFYLDRRDIQRYPQIGPLLASGGKINTSVMEAQWKDMIDVAAVVQKGVTPPSRILRKLQTRGEHDDLYRALQQTGRLSGTPFILNYLASPEMQHEIERQLNKTENFHSLADRVLFGQKGEFRLRDYRDQLNRASCLRLVNMIIILNNAAYLQAAREQWAREGYTISDEMLSHVYPTFSEHIQFLGDYSFDVEPKLATKIDRLPLRPIEAESYDLPGGLWQPR